MKYTRLLPLTLIVFCLALAIGCTGQPSKAVQKPSPETIAVQTPSNALVPVALLDDDGGWGEFITPVQEYELYFRKSHILNNPEELSIDTKSIFIQSDWTADSSRLGYFLCARGSDSSIGKEVFLRMTLSSQYGLLSFHSINANPLKVYRCFENNPNCKPVYNEGGAIDFCFDAVKKQMCQVSTFKLN